MLDQEPKLVTEEGVIKKLFCKVLSLLSYVCYRHVAYSEPPEVQILEKILSAIWLKYPTFLVKNDHIFFEFFS